MATAKKTTRKKAAGTSKKKSTAKRSPTRKRKTTEPTFPPEVDDGVVAETLAAATRAKEGKE